MSSSSPLPRCYSMRLPIVFALLLPSLAAQETFKDKDFEFSMRVPSGMSAVGAEVLAGLHGVTVEQVAIVPRAQAEGGRVRHEYRWQDDTGHEREIALVLIDEAPPFRSPESFAAAIQAQLALDIHSQDRVMRGKATIGLLAEGERARDDGVLVRQRVAYFPLDVDRHGILTMQALVPDWDIYSDDFRDMVQSVTFPTPDVGRSDTARGGQGQAGQGGARRGRRPPEDWTSLEVTGSFVLSALLLMSILMGGGRRSG